MKRFLDIAQLCEVLSISKTRYHEMKRKGTAWYDPKLPKPIPTSVFNDSKIRFYSEDVERYIESKMSKAA
jgi:predicted DNA-binding transcriptional regulator AlpA